MSLRVTDQIPPPPEAVLIRRAREAKALSPESAAALMLIKFSGSRWRQIEAGYRKDIRRPVTGKPEIIAHMADTVGVAPDRLAEAGREDAAEILREIQRAAEPQASDVDVPAWMRNDPRVWAIWTLDLPLDERIQGVRDLVEADLRRAREQEERQLRRAG